VSLSAKQASAIVAYAFDEASGDAIDDVGSIDLDDLFSSIGTTSGLLGNARDLDAAADSFKVTNAALQVADTAYHVSFFIRFGATSGTVMERWDGGGGNREFTLFFGSNKLNIAFDGPTAGVQILEAANAGALSTATWYLVCFWHDPVANQIGISIHGAASSTANTLSFAGGSYSSTSSFEIGKGEMNADIDELVILQGALLDSTERDELWNGGTGVAFADWAGGGGTNRRRRLLICGAAA
jgi:hypothetical protein